MMNANAVKDRSMDRAMRLYLKEISMIPLLTAEEEKELGYRAQACDRDALQKLIESNLRFVITIARRFRFSGLPILDLINEGNVGLIKAASRFDPNHNTRFTSYAVWWIRQAILFYLSQASQAFRVSPKIANISYRVARALAKIRNEHTEIPDKETLAQLVGASLKELNAALDAIAGTLQLDHPIDDVSKLILGETLEQTTFNSAETETIVLRRKEQLNMALSILTQAEQKVLKLRFGLEDDHPQTMREIGARMNRSRERIRQIEGTALAKLRKSFGASSLPSYLN